MLANAMIDDPKYMGLLIEALEEPKRSAMA